MTEVHEARRCREQSCAAVHCSCGGEFSSRAAQHEHAAAALREEVVRLDAFLVAIAAHGKTTWADSSMGSGRPAGQVLTSEVHGDRSGTGRMVGRGKTRVVERVAEGHRRGRQCSIRGRRSTDATLRRGRQRCSLPRSLRRYSPMWCVEQCDADADSNVALKGPWQEKRGSARS